jgi:hypothetical protein
VDIEQLVDLAIRLARKKGVPDAARLLAVAADDDFLLLRDAADRAANARPAHAVPRNGGGDELPEVVLLGLAAEMLEDAMVEALRRRELS